jgi:putative flavoprotein involved in K+ transport
MPQPLNSPCQHDVIIIGAGSSGLSLAYHLLQRGLHPLVLDAATEVAASWRKRHPQLSLNTHRLLSNLPGSALPKANGTFVSRDDFIKYLEGYEQELKSKFKLNIRYGQEVTKIKATGRDWQVNTKIESYQTAQLIIATGGDKETYLPKWLGTDTYKGSIIHARDLGEVEQYDDKNVLVVGGANSGIDIANHLIQRNRYATLTLSIRSGVHLVPTYFLGIPLQLTGPLLARLPVTVQDLVAGLISKLCFGDLKKFGVLTPAEGVASRMVYSKVAPGFDHGFVKALKAGRVTVVPDIKRLTAQGVVFKDGASRPVDHIIGATGYRTGLDKILPQQCVGVKGTFSNLPGLTVFGLNPKLAGNIYARCAEAKILAANIARQSVSD